MSAFAGWWEASLLEIKISMAETMQYRASMLIWIVAAVLEPLIFLIVWSVVARESGGEVNGMTPGDFAAYFVTALFVSRFTFNWLNWTYEEYIRDGTLASRLMRPYPTFLQDLMNNIGYKIIGTSIVIPVALVLGLIFNATFTPVAWSLAAAVPVLALSFITRFTLEWLVALCAFWFTRMRAINNLYYTSLLLLSGMIAPLDFYPPAIQTLSYLFPWRWLIYFPIQTILGRLTPQEVAIGIGAQMAWLVVISIATALFWRESIRKFASVGG